MDRASLPFVLIASPAARAQLGRDLTKVAVLAAQAILRSRKSLEIAHQQMRYRKHAIAFSSRVGRYGDLILEIDIGDPALDNRMILEADLRQAELLQAAKNRREPPRRMR